VTSRKWRKSRGNAALDEKDIKQDYVIWSQNGGCASPDTISEKKSITGTKQAKT